MKQCHTNSNSWNHEIWPFRINDKMSEKVLSIHYFCSIHVPWDSAALPENVFRQFPQEWKKEPRCATMSTFLNTSKKFSIWRISIIKWFSSCSVTPEFIRKNSFSVEWPQCHRTDFRNTNCKSKVVKENLNNKIKWPICAWLIVRF